MYNMKHSLGTAFESKSVALCRPIFVGFGFTLQAFVDHDHVGRQRFQYVAQFVGIFGTI